jgi:predicted MFS family arabinose efflux permease
MAITVGIGAACLAVLGVVALIFLRERPVAKRDQNVMRNVKHEMRTLVRHRVLWWAIICYGLFYFAPGFGTPLYFYQTDTLKLSQQFIGNLGLFAGATGMIGAVIYGLVCRKLPLRKLMIGCVVINIIITLFYEFYRTPTAAICVEALNGFGSTIADLAFLDLAARATPRGSEALGYGLMMSVRNAMLNGGDVLGSQLTDRYHVAFSNLVYLNAGTTALVLLIIPFLPRAIMSRRDGDLA